MLKVVPKALIREIAAKQMKIEDSKKQDKNKKQTQVKTVQYSNTQCAHQVKNKNAKKQLLETQNAEK